MDETTQAFRDGLTRLRKRSSADAMLATVASLEHMTSVISAFLLRHGELNKDDDAYVVIQWHCLEEIEHKSVCFDVYQTCVGDLGLRRRRMLGNLFGFSMMIARALWIQLRSRRLPPRQLWDGTCFMVSLWSTILWSGLQYMHADFHPNNTDDSHLIANWQQQYPTVAARI